MCRNIKTLFNFDPPVTPEEVQAASLQFVRKISGFNKPSKANEAVWLGGGGEIGVGSGGWVGVAAEEGEKEGRQARAAGGPLLLLPPPLYSTPSPFLSLFPPPFFPWFRWLGI